MNFFSMDFKLLSICLVLVAVLPATYGHGSSEEGHGSSEKGDEVAPPRPTSGEVLPIHKRLKCHQCDTLTNKDCADPFVNEDGSPKTNAYLTWCRKGDNVCQKEWKQQEGHGHGHHGHQGISRVVRTCGNAAVGCKDNVCSCDTEGCNSASMFGVSSVAMFSVLLLALYSMQ